ncbi:MAG: autotransporter assembly complex protein TamA [Woeseiaceae bacterium]
MSTVFPQFVPGGRSTLALLCCCLLSASALAPTERALADEITYAISGIDEPLSTNVRSYVEEFGLARSVRISAGQFEDLEANAKLRAREALKPYGYYHPDIATHLEADGKERWRLNMRIRRGPPVRVRSARIELHGPGTRFGGLMQWKAEWPLVPGVILDQAVWAQEKQEVLDVAASQGYLSANFTEHSLKLDLVANQADLTLVLETGPQAHFGKIEFLQDEVEPDVLANVPRFEAGSEYRSELVDKLRLDLWQTGYFTDIEVAEERALKQTPPTVDIVANLRTETRTTYQGTLGFGTDTGIRTQLFMSRSPLSSKGDRIDLGAGYQEIDDEFSLRADYKIPRHTENRQFWVSSVALRRDKQDLEVKRNEDDEDFITLAPGNVDDLFFKFGRLQQRNREEGKDQFFETVFVQYLRESYLYDPGPDAPPPIRELVENPQFGGLFHDTIRTLAVGIEWDWPSIRGSGFETDGHHERAWLFTSNEVWGSDREFTQLYLSSRRTWLRGERWKFLLRAEAGFTDADVDNLVLDIGGEPFDLSVTQLPDQYRFKAGGGNSVRGYGFEDLSNNDIGSNNIIAASAEVEFRVFDKWSVSAFADIGNAFNNWDEFELRKGAGIGVRWYSIAGAIRLDFAQALDIEGRPWRIHFTIGTQLL